MNQFIRRLMLLLMLVLAASAYSGKPFSAYYYLQKERGVRVDGIYISRTRRVAKINGQFYVLGDVIPKRGLLVAILKDRVVIDEETGLEVYQMLKKHKES